MNSKAAAGFSLVRREDAAVNEYTGIPERLAEARSDLAAGWDPYEVWRNRVKAPAKAGKRPPREPRT